jgi:hypothetical protein
VGTRVSRRLPLRDFAKMQAKVLPTIEAIQRTTIVVAAVVAVILWIEASPASAAGCMLGAVLMVANLSALSWTVRTMFGLARQAGGVNAFGVIAAPLKMLLLAGVAYLIIQSGRVNVAGFVAGTLTQFVAIFIEVGRSSFLVRFSAP